MRSSKTLFISWLFWGSTPSWGNASFTFTSYFVEYTLGPLSWTRLSLATSKGWLFILEFEKQIGLSLFSLYIFRFYKRQSHTLVKCLPLKTEEFFLREPPSVKFSSPTTIKIALTRDVSSTANVLPDVCDQNWTRNSSWGKKKLKNQCGFLLEAMTCGSLHFETVTAFPRLTPNPEHTISFTSWVVYSFVNSFAL